MIDTDVLSAASLRKCGFIILLALVIAKCRENQPVSVWEILLNI